MRKTLILILLIIASISGSYVIDTYNEYKKAVQYYGDIQETYVTIKTLSTATPTPISVIENNEIEINNPVTKNSEPIIKRHTTTKKPPISINFSALRKKNKDVIGWIYNEGTVINYPIMQTSNNVYYLRHLTDGSYSVSGSIFLDSINNKYFLDDNSILYGHHMKNGSMFASIEKYKKQSYYNEHPELWLLTPKQNYLLMPFAGLVVTPSREEYFMHEFKSEEERKAYVKFALENSSFVGEMAPNAADRIITLTTCDYTFKNARFILVCTMLPVV